MSTNNITWVNSATHCRHMGWGVGQHVARLRKGSDPVHYRITALGEERVMARNISKSIIGAPEQIIDIRFSLQETWVKV